MRLVVCVALAGLLIPAAHNDAAAQTAPAAPAISAPAQPADAKAILQRMANYLAQAKAFSVTINANYDVVQDDGQKIEFGEIRHITVNRPDGLRVDRQTREGAKQEVRFDGQTITMAEPGQPFFASLTWPGTVDQILYHVVQDLKTPIPLSLLLVTTLPQELQKRVSEVELVDDEVLGGKDVSHLAARTDEIDFQVWVAKGDQPVPLRAVITYKKAPGSPQFQADLADWNFAPQIDKAMFVFVPPAGAMPVPFMVPASSELAPSTVGNKP